MKGYEIHIYRLILPDFPTKMVLDKPHHFDTFTFFLTGSPWGQIPHGSSVRPHKSRSPAEPGGSIPTLSGWLASRVAQGKVVAKLRRSVNKKSGKKIEMIFRNRSWENLGMISKLWSNIYGGVKWSRCNLPKAYIVSKCWVSHFVPLCQSAILGLYPWNCIHTGKGPIVGKVDL